MAGRTRQKQCLQLRTRA